MSQHGCPKRLSNMSKGFQEDGGGQATMEVLVETLTGTAFEMTVSPSDTVFAIKSKIFRVEGIPVSQQHLLYNLKELDDASCLREHAISDGARLRLVLGMRGGPISTRRLPPPPNSEQWRDIESLLDSNRDEGEYGAGAGAGCKVTVLVFRDGDRVNMLRVREHHDGTYAPIDHTKYSPPVPERSREPSGSRVSRAWCALQQNAVTMGKMIDLRRRMHTLSLHRPTTTHTPKHTTTDAHIDTECKAEIQKTRSEETLSVPSLLDEPDTFANRTYTPYSEGEDTFAPLYDGNYTRYDYDCSFTDRYTLLPPIGSRSDSDQSIQDDVKLSDLAGSILVKGRRETRDDDAAILEECLEGTVEECLRQDSPQLAAKQMAPIPAAEFGPLVCGSGGSGGDEAMSSGWRVRGFGSSSQLAPPAPLAAVPSALSASALHVRPPTRHAPLSSSTSDLETLKRNRILPALSRHRNREHLHLSDEGLDVAKPRNLEVGSERRQRRIKKIAELENSKVYHFGDFDTDEPAPIEDKKEKKTPRIRCGFCRKKLSIATVHRCRCGAEFCAPHRYAEVHGCAYDYKASAHHYLQRANPLVSAPKLPKI